MEFGVGVVILSGRFLQCPLTFRVLPKAGLPALPLIGKIKVEDSTKVSK